MKTSNFLATMAIGIPIAFNVNRCRVDARAYGDFRLRKRGTVARNRAEKVSVLVAAWNEADAIDRCIKSITSLSYHHKELVVCAGGDDGTYDSARQHENGSVRVLKQAPREGKQRALRRCLTASTGEIIFLTDADCVLTDEVFESTLEPILDGREVAATGSYEPLAEQRDLPLVTYQWAIQLYGRIHADAYSAGLLGANCAVRRADLERSGGFDAEAPTGTDYVLARTLSRAGHRLRSMPASAVATHFESSARGYLRQRARWLRNLLLHGVSHRCGADVRHVLVTGLIGVLGLTLPLLGIAVGGGILFAVIVLSGGGMGGGDMKLGAMMGAFLGYKLALLALFVAVILGGAVALALLSVGVRKRKDPIPFGPFLAVAAALALLWGEAVLRWYLSVFSLTV